MRALHFNSELILTDAPTPVPAEGEALIRMLAAGVCRTDLEIVQGYMGFTGILGHEFVGEVEQCTGKPEWEGKRVCGEINLAPWAENSVRQRHDPKRTVLGILGKDGCFADYLTLPVVNLVEIPESISDEEAVFVEPLAAAFEILEQVELDPEDRIAVIGDGKLGLLCAQVLRLENDDVTLIGKYRSKLVIAEKQGVAALHIDELEAVANAYDIVVDATGRPEGLTTSLRLVRPRGVLVMKTTTATPPDFNLAKIVIDEITLIGSRCGQFSPAVDALKQGAIDVKSMIEARYPLERGLDAFEHAARPGALKVLICS